MMEHISQKQISAKYVMLIPDAGYALTDGKGTYDKATVNKKDLHKWKAVIVDGEYR